MEKRPRPTVADVVCIGCFLFALFAQDAHIARAQSSRRDDSAVTPRIANRYDHKEFQATTTSVCVGANAAGVDCSSAAGAKAQEELNLIWRQIQEIEKSYPPGFLSGMKDKQPER